MKKLIQAYDTKDFNKRGNQLIADLTQHLEQCLTETNPKTIDWNTPDKELLFWKDYLKNGKEETFFKTVLAHSIHVHNPKYIGHQVSPTAPITALSGLLSSFLNNGMAVYEMGMASSAIERIITDFICSKIGYSKNANGILTSGGTLANLTALLSARKSKAGTNVWDNGNANKLGIMVSEEAHYCIDRAAKIMGLGNDGIIKIPSNENYAMDVSQLESTYKKANENGITVFAIVGSAPSTATGIYDNLEAIAKFSEEKNIWFHVDGAHGGAAIFSPKYKHTVSGIKKADSVVIDGHKMMMMPAMTTALLFKNGNDSHATFNQKAAYLLEDSQEEDWYNMAKRTFECTKNMMCMHWFALLKTYGEEIFDEYVTVLYNLGHRFGKMIAEHPNFELAIEPSSNIVCFRYISDGLSTIELNKINKNIRQKILEEGKFYIVQTKLRGIHYLRTTIMNPFTTDAHLKELLDCISR